MDWKKNPELIDFSPLHDYLLEDEDGNILPADVPYFKEKKIAPGTWQILSHGDYIYLVEGEDEAIVIDSGIGCGNIREFCQSLTNKPVWRMLLTHNHYDHTLNCYLFDAVYMSPKCYEKRWDSMGSVYGALKVPTDYPVVFLHHGDVIDLGGRQLQVLNIEEHCRGSLQFLDKKERILFCGDELNGNFCDSRISVEHTFRNMCAWKALRGDYDTLCAGNGIHTAEYVDRYYDTLKYILEGHIGEGKEYYVPQMDDRAKVSELDGKKVHLRRSPDMDMVVDLMRAAGMEKHLENSGGLGCFCWLRKLTPDGAFDRQLEMNDCRVCYYINRIWDPKEERGSAL